MPDQYGYPTEDELKKLAELKAPDQIIKCLEYIWWMADWGLVKHWGRSSLRRKKVLKLELHTGGWSGNEEIIGVLKGHSFWMFFWESSRRGGHYYFEIPAENVAIELPRIKKD